MDGIGYSWSTLPRLIEPGKVLFRVEKLEMPVTKAGQPYLQLTLLVKNEQAELTEASALFFNSKFRDENWKGFMESIGLGELFESGRLEDLTILLGKKGYGYVDRIPGKKKEDGSQYPDVMQIIEFYPCPETAPTAVAQAETTGNEAHAMH